MDLDPPEVTQTNFDFLSFYNLSWFNHFRYLYWRTWEKYWV